MKRLFVFLLAFSMVLSMAACKTTTQELPETTEATTLPPETTEAATEATTEATEPTTEETTEPAPQYQNPLNGEPVDALYTARPYAVTINNIEYAMPQCSVANAQIIYEILAEGGITRCLAVYDDLSGIDHIGSIRSARTYFVDLVLGLDAIYVHHGYSSYAKEALQVNNVNDLCPLRGRGASAYYRDQDRLNAGYSLEHTSFADGDDLIQAAVKLGYAQEREEGMDYGWSFVEDGTPKNGADAQKVTVNFRKGGKTTRFTYDSVKGVYSAVQYGKDYIDGNSDEIMTFRNILVLTAVSYTDSKGYRQFVEMTNTEGTGYYACGGKLIPILWSRGDVSEPFVYTLEDGTPLEMGIGRSYVAIVPLNSPVDYE